MHTERRPSTELKEYQVRDEKKAQELSYEHINFMDHAGAQCLVIRLFSPKYNCGNY